MMNFLGRRQGFQSAIGTRLICPRLLAMQIPVAIRRARSRRAIARPAGLLISVRPAARLLIVLWPALLLAS